MDSKPMNIVIFGGAGATGRHLTDRALQEGHMVTVAVRNSTMAFARHDRLRVVQCDVRDAEAVRSALRGQEVALCSLGGPRRGVTVYSEGARNVVNGMRELNVRRLVFLSNYGVLGETARGVATRVLLVLAKLVLRDTLADHLRALEIVRNSGKQWVAVRPMTLTNAAGTGRYRIDIDGLPAKGTHIARADVAHFMLRAAVSDAYLYKVPSIAY
jgi:nucleoside-diphosphate-sugar epimerase